MKKIIHPYSRPPTLPKNNPYNINNVKTPLEPPFHLYEGSDKGNVYYHYTNEAGKQDINRDRALSASARDEQGNMRGLCRIYLTDICPRLMKENKVLYAPLIFGRATYQSWRAKTTYCYILNLSNLTVEKGTGEHIYYVKNVPFLPIRYILNGNTVNRVIACIHVDSGAAI